MFKTSIPRIVSSLIWRLVDDNILVVSPQTGEMRVLNNIGSVIWQYLADQKTPDYIIDQLATQYDVTIDKARDDFQAFLSDLDERNMIKWDKFDDCVSPIGLLGPQNIKNRLTK